MASTRINALGGFRPFRPVPADGALVVDLSPIWDREDFDDLVWSAPLCDPTLSDGGLRGSLILTPAPGSSFLS